MTPEEERRRRTERLNDDESGDGPRRLRRERLERVRTQVVLLPTKGHAMAKLVGKAQQQATEIEEAGVRKRCCLVCVALLSQARVVAGRGRGRGWAGKMERPSQWVVLLLLLWRCCLLAELLKEGIK